MSFPSGLAGKESACNVGDMGSISGLGRSPGEGIGYPLQYSGLENSMDFPGSSDGKVSVYNVGDPGFDPWVGKIPWRMKWQPTPVLLPGKSHGQRSLVGYSPLGRYESDTTE
ncbi:unnamed protein product [Rangifer tarandus platyrhynchus]|uniref:Uncharacterized protein n=1 Tax=Rangifer tarandus platyrhynchus TaxID=3082113 RepID=A0ABN8XXJ2_RANTA|nr:unnamed protein product [Rangifer tarandus platyrhynchus]